MDDIEDKPLRLRRHEEGPKIKLIQADAMKISYSDIYSKYKITRVVSNLPYKISAPLIIKILTEAPQIAELYLTIQKDIADRVLAGPGQKNYSSYTVKSGYLADFKLLFKISRTCFMPAPHVDSVFIKAVQKNCLPETNSGMIYTDEFKKSYFEFVDYCFIHRRKKLINSLLESKKHQILEKIDMVAGILSDFGKDTDIRAEELKPEEIFTLFIKIFKNPCIKN
jgi:16S rRNA (adenine1518-N6/adenine1519-N6)-dimethyltransferase